MDDTELRRLAGEAFQQMQGEASHLSLERTAEFARGELSGSRRDEVERHLTECAPCRLRVDELEQFLADCESPSREDLTEEWQKIRSRILWHKAVTSAPRWGAIAAVVIVAIGLTWLVIWILTPSPARLLAQAYHQQRSFDLRLAGAEYAQVRQQRGGESVFSFPGALLKAQARLAEEIKSNPDDPETLRLKGEAEMMVGQAAAAVQTLERARDLQPQDAHILSDLGAAYALRGDLEKQFDDYANALEYLGRSVHLRPGALETIFNLALVLERMMLKDQAIEKWEEYLRLDNASDWAKEAREHLSGLTAELKSREDALHQIVNDPAQFLAMAASGNGVDAEAYLREIAVTKWLPRVASDNSAKEATVRLAQILKERHGDFWLAEIVNSRSGSELLTGLEELAAARSANQRGNAEAAITAARDAQQIFLRAGNRPGSLWARFEAVLSLHRLLRRDECLAAAEELIHDIGVHPYIWLRTQLLVIDATYTMRAGRLSEAAPLLREARRISQAAGFGEAQLRASINYLDCIRHIGLPSEIFAAARASLQTFWSGAYPAIRFQQIASRLRSIAVGADQKYAAWFFARSDLWAAGATRDAAVEATARANLAVAAKAIGEDDEARAQLEISEPLFAKLPVAYRLEPMIDLANIELGRRDVDDALNRLDVLRAALDPAPTVLIETRYYSALGEAYRLKGLPDLALDAFGKSIERGVRRVAALSTESERAGVLKTIEKSYRGLVAATLSLPGGDAEALRTWQSFRTLDTVGTPSNAHRVNHPVLSFVELPDGFVSWLAWKDQVRMHRFNASKDAVAEVVGRFRRECSDPGSGRLRLLKDAQQLYQWMVEPFATELADQDRNLIFELDGVLTGIPVQALISRDEQYLGDRFSVLVSSGYTTKPQAAALSPNAKALVIANPLLAGEGAARFPNLPESLKEAEVLRTTFSANSVLEGPNATIRALEGLLPAVDVVHFAGHGYSNSDGGALLFARSDSKGPGYEMLRSAELRHQDWSRCRLAVLSACASAEGEIRGPHNPDSLVRALTRAGASRVAASLWNVDSAATTELMRAFYKSLAGGADPMQALRVAQQWMRAQSNWTHPYYWAGFQMYGTT